MGIYIYMYTYVLAYVFLCFEDTPIWHMLTLCVCIHIYIYIYIHTCVWLSRGNAEIACKPPRLFTNWSAEAKRWETGNDWTLGCHHTNCQAQSPHGFADGRSQNPAATAREGAMCKHCPCSVGRIPACIDRLPGKLFLGKTLRPQ